jgi:hypothetical protein
VQNIGALGNYWIGDDPERSIALTGGLVANLIENDMIRIITGMAGLQAQLGRLRFRGETQFSGAGLPYSTATLMFFAMAQDNPWNLALAVSAIGIDLDEKHRKGQGATQLLFQLRI